MIAGVTIALGGWGGGKAGRRAARRARGKVEGAGGRQRAPARGEEGEGESGLVKRGGGGHEVATPSLVADSLIMIRPPSAGALRAR